MTTHYTEYFEPLLDLPSLLGVIPTTPPDKDIQTEKFTIFTDGDPRYQSPDFLRFLSELVNQRCWMVSQPKQKKMRVKGAKRAQAPRVWNPKYPQTADMIEANTKWITDSVDVFFEHEYETPEEVEERRKLQSIASIQAPKAKHVVRYHAKLRYADRKKRLTHLIFTSISAPVTPERQMEIMGPTDAPIVYKSLAGALCTAANYPGIESEIKGDRANARSKWRRLLPGGVPQMLRHFMSLLRFDMKLEELQNFIRENPERMPPRKRAKRKKVPEPCVKTENSEPLAREIVEANELLVKSEFS